MTHPCDEVHPILSLPIHLATDEERDALQQELEVLARQNPTARIDLGSIEGQLIISGEDELELEAIGKKILLAHRAEIGHTQGQFRETVRKSAEAEGRYLRQLGGSGNYGHCRLRIEPARPGSGYEFVNDTTGGVIPEEYIKPVDEGVQAAMASGILAGFPLVDLKVTLVDGSYHDVDSNEMAFRIAGSIAFKESVRKASPVVLEPMMAVEVTVPEEFTGTVIADINSPSRAHRRNGTACRSRMIHATLPLAEVLRSSTHGRPEYSMRFVGYQAAPRRDGLDGNDAGHLCQQAQKTAARFGFGCRRARTLAIFFAAVQWIPGMSNHLAPTIE